MLYDAIVFDLDGTLVDSEPIANGTFADHLIAQGLPVTHDEVDQLFTGLAFPDCYALIRERWGIALGQDFHDRLQAATLARYETELKSMPHVQDVLPRLMLPKAVASNSEREKLRYSLTVTGLLPHFDPHIFSADDVPQGKPDPAIYRLATERLGADPRRAVAVEDSWVGLQSARAAGLAVLFYAPVILQPKDTVRPDRLDLIASARAAGAQLFADMRALPSLLGAA